MGVDALQVSSAQYGGPQYADEYERELALKRELARRRERQPEEGGGDSILAIAPAPPSFRRWLAESLVEEEAAVKIQSFLRSRLKLRVSYTASTASTVVSTVASATPDASAVAVVASEPPTQDSDQLQYEILLWYGASLGAVHLSPCELTGYPCVTAAGGNDSLPGMWNLRKGDFLIAVNDRSTNRTAVPFEAVLQILESGVRPAVLRFRRPASHELQSLTTRSRRASLGGGSADSVRSERQRSRERLERSLCYLIWREEDGPLGLSLKPEQGKSYPVVAAMNKRAGVVNRAGPRHKLRVGDQLLTINHFDVFRLGFKKTCQVMQFAPKPLVLTFRRTAPEPATPRSLDL